MIQQGLIVLNAPKLVEVHNNMNNSNSSLSKTSTDNKYNQCKNTYYKEEVHVVTETKIYICSKGGENTVLFKYFICEQ